MICPTPSTRHRIRFAVLLGLLLCGLPALSALAAPRFSQFIVFGDSLSDTGNDANVSKGEYDVTFPGEDFNYTTGRFTNGSDTNPPSTVYSGVWHEQLAKLFFNLPAAVNSLNGGMDYAYGGATTQDGTADLGPDNPIASDLNVTIKIDNMGQQVSDYLSNNSTDPKALYIVWGGANDLFNDDSSTNAVAAADRETALIDRLAQAGAVTFLVPNLPPLGATPDYQDHDEKVITQSTIDFIKELNADLTTLEANLKTEGLKVKIYRLDVYGLFNKLLLNQYAYGFTNITDSSQGMSVKADQYLFWDGVHPTVAGHYQLAAEAYSLLTGVPVVEVNVAPGGTLNSRGALSIFYFTRTGTNIATAFQVPYTVGGTAEAGTDYVALPGHRNIKAGKQSVTVAVDEGTTPPTKPAKTISLTIKPGPGYHLPVVPTATVKLLPQPAGD
jgi:phospholipase/lecithinase/hemolysin